MAIIFDFDNQTYKLEICRKTNGEINESFRKISYLDTPIRGQKNKCIEILQGLGYWEDDFRDLEQYQIGKKLYDKIILNHIPFSIISEENEENNIIRNVLQTNVNNTNINGSARRNRIPTVHNVRPRVNNNATNRTYGRAMCAYRTTEHSLLSPREFYNRVYELLKVKYKNSVWPRLSLEDSNARLERYFHLTDQLDEWIYKNLLNLNLDTPENQINYLFAQFVYHSLNRGHTGFTSFYDNYENFQNCFNQFNVTSFLDDCNNNPNLVINNIASLRTANSNRDNEVLMRYFNLYKNIATYLVTYHSKEEVVLDLLNHKDDNDPLSVPNYLLDIVSRGNYFKIALACDYLKEIDDRFNYLFKPDQHVIDFLDNYYGLNWTLKAKDALQLGINLVHDINSDHGEEVTCYKFDRMIYLLGSGNFFLDHVKESTVTAPAYKWETVLPNINPRR